MADGLTDDQVSSTLDYLGGGQPGIAPRLTTMPGEAAGGGAVNAPVSGGTAGAPGSPQRPLGQNVSAPGASPFAIVGQSLKLGKNLTSLASSLFKSDPAARGTVGGEGSNQDATKSLSDNLRSAAGSGVGSGVPPEGSALSTPPPESLGTGLITGGELGSGVPAPGSMLSTPNPDAPESAAGALGGLGSVSAGGGAVSAALALAAMLTGNKQVGTAASAVGDAASIVGDIGALTGEAAGAIGEATAAGAGVGGAVGAGAAAAGGGLAGLGAALAGPLAVVTAPLLFASIAHLAGVDPGSLDIADMFGGGFDTAGSSKRTTARRISGGMDAFNDVQVIDQATQAASDARAKGVTDPTQLRALGDEIMQARSSVFSGDPRFNEGQASVDKKLGNLEQQWLSINQYLTSKGEPGLTVGTNWAQSMGLGLPPNASTLQNTDKGDLSLQDSAPATVDPDVMSFLGLDPKGSYTVGQINTFLQHPEIQNRMNPSSPEMQALYQKQLLAKLGAPSQLWGASAPATTGGPPAAAAAPPTPSALDFSRTFSDQPLASLPGGPEGALGFAQEMAASAP